MKLLWGSILQLAGNRPDCINSSHVNKMWKKLCSDKNYSKICHYEDEIINKVEKSLNKHSKDIKHKQLNNNKINFNKMNNNKNGNICDNSFEISSSSILNVPSVSPFTSPANSSTGLVESHQNEISSSCYPSPISSEFNICLNENIQYCEAPFPLNIYNSNLYCDINGNNQINSNLYYDMNRNNQINSNIISIPSNSYINVIEYPMIEIQYPLQPVNNKNYILFSDYQN